MSQPIVLVTFYSRSGRTETLALSHAVGAVPIAPECGSLWHVLHVSNLGCRSASFFAVPPWHFSHATFA